jgi:hypothetical protein
VVAELVVYRHFGSMSAITQGQLCRRLAFIPQGLGVSLLRV